MRAAPPPSASADDGAPTTDPTSEPFGRRGDRPFRWGSSNSRLRRVGLVVLILIVVAAPIVFLLTRNGAKRTRSAPSPNSTSTTSPRPQFAFAVPAVTIELLGRKKAPQNTKGVATQIQSDLSLFYDQGFVDPKTWEKPWTGEYTWPITQDHLYEYACHEGNYAMGNILRGARLRESEDTKTKSKQQ